MKQSETKLGSAFSFEFKPRLFNSVTLNFFIFLFLICDSSRGGRQL